MQNRRSNDASIKFLEVTLDDAFPISFFRYTQKHHDLKKLHYHSAFEIGLCLEGSGLFFIESKTLPFKEGDVSFVFPNQPHIAQSPNEIPSNWFFLTVDLHRLFPQELIYVNELLINKLKIPNILPPMLDEGLSQMIKLVLLELEEKKANFKLVVKTLIYGIMLKVLRLQIDDHAPLALSSSAFTTIYPALNYISSFYSEEMTTEQLANFCHLSVTHFRVVFKKATNTTPLQYLTQVRMKMAKTLLISNKSSILTISHNVGYTSISSFNRSFKEAFGMTPSEFRGK